MYISIKYALVICCHQIDNPHVGFTSNTYITRAKTAKHQLKSRDFEQNQPRPHRQPTKHRISIDPWRRREYPTAAAHQTSMKQMIGRCARKPNLPYIGVARSPPKPRLPPPTTVQSDGALAVEGRCNVGLVAGVGSPSPQR